MSGVENQRLEGWLRKLLDLTLRNPLINLRPSRGVAFLCPSARELLARLETAAGDGVLLRAFPWSDTTQSSLDRWLASEQWLDIPGQEEAPARDQEDYLLRDEATARGRRARRAHLMDTSWDPALEAFSRGDLVVDALPDDLQDDLADLDRQQRVRQQEGGVHTLYLAVGLLRWKEQANASGWVESPLLLVPVQLARDNAQRPYRLLLRDESPVFNPSLAHKIRQDFGLEININIPEEGMDWSLLDDAWEQVRAAIEPMSAWSILPEVRLGLFSFHKQHLWNDLAARAEAVLSHPVVARIAGGDHARDRTEVFSDWDTLDARFSPKDLLTPLPVDASQMRALSLVDEGRDLVIDGPPGTGKSQTITNLIAHALGKGKRVLFVSEKSTALSVVHDRLEELGLGPFCLDLHSSKAQKAEVVAQFRRTMDVRSNHDGQEWATRADELHQQRQNLNDALSELHVKRSNGYSLFQAIGLWSRLSPPDHALDVDLGPVHLQSSGEYEDIRKAVSSWARAHSMLPPSAARFHVLANAGGLDTEDFLLAIDQALDALSGIESASRAIGVQPDTMAQVRGWVEILALALRSPSAVADRLWILHEQRPESVRAYHDAKRQYAQAWAGPSKVFHQAVLNSVKSWQAQWSEALASSWWSSWSRRRAIRRQLSQFSLSGKPPSDAQVIQLLQSWPDIHESHVTLRKLDKEVDARMRKEIKGREDWQPWLAAAEWAQEAMDLARSAPSRWGLDTGQVLGVLASPSPSLDAARHQRLADLLEQFDQACIAWRCVFPPTHDGLPGTGEAAALETWRCHWQEWRSVRPAWPAWKHAESSARKLRAAGLDRLIEASIQYRWSPAQTEEAWLSAYWRTWISRVQEGIPQWDGLGRRRESTIADFAVLDTQVEHGTRHEILARLCASWKQVERLAPPSEMRVLQHEIGKKRAHLPPRQLLSKIPTLWPAMKPCLLMSPLSAAQHLGPETPLFDLVVFDEASQISVADAVGVIARGKQVVVVGDPKQMPPSRLFDASEMEDEEDPLTERDLDSILDECLSSMDRVLLNWHYRSRHEDLIAFSNHRYYNGELITFPSPHNREAGLVVHEVNGGYERAGRRINRAEAEAVVAAVASHYLTPGCVPSLGVITFNQNQQRLINRLMDARRASDPALDAAMSASQEEFFVKNLETVQGDERDHIFFSTTFAPDAAGNFPMQFGPLGQVGGERRLNVAITRARHRVEIFTSFHPGQMDVGNLRHRGVKDLRDYLLFARGGEQALLSVSVPTLGVADSPFEVSVREALEARGWEVVPQVGCSGYRIDMAIKHPDRPGEYLAGIECDGATYHSFKVARDRDRMRQRVLERLGWKIARIWSTDWWQDASDEIDRVHEQLCAWRSQGE